MTDLAYMDRDSWNEILNGERTYIAIANELAANGTVFIGWTDGLHSHFDILLTAHVTLPQGHFQRGIKPHDLFVSVMSVGAFGFEILDADVDGGYVDEKFGKFFGTATADQIAHLISGVRRKLWDHRNIQEMTIGRLTHDTVHVCALTPNGIKHFHRREGHWQKFDCEGCTDKFKEDAEKDLHEKIAKKGE